MKAYLNDKEIPIEDCLNDKGGLIMPEYMKEGDIIKFISKQPIYVGAKTEYSYLPEISKALH